MPFTPFTLEEVKSILRKSEARGGHAGARHVSITTNDLWGRMGEARNNSIAAFTAFLNFNDQAGAALELLNDPAHEQALEQFRVNSRQGDRVTLRHRLRAPIRMRYAIGEGSQTFPCSAIRLVIEKDHSSPRAMHVVTCMGEMGG